jgi:hypothetical protein
MVAVATAEVDTVPGMLPDMEPEAVRLVTALQVQGTT